MNTQSVAFRLADSLASVARFLWYHPTVHIAVTRVLS